MKSPKKPSAWWVDLLFALAAAAALYFGSDGDWRIAFVVVVVMIFSSFDTRSEYARSISEGDQWVARETRWMAAFKKPQPLRNVLLVIALFYISFVFSPNQNWPFHVGICAIVVGYFVSVHIYYSVPSKGNAVSGGSVDETSGNPSSKAPGAMAATAEMVPPWRLATSLPLLLMILAFLWWRSDYDWRVVIVLVPSGAALLFFEHFRHKGSVIMRAEAAATGD